MNGDAQRPSREAATPSVGAPVSPRGGLDLTNNRTPPAHARGYADAAASRLKSYELRANGFTSRQHRINHLTRHIRQPNPSVVVEIPPLLLIKLSVLLTIVEIACYAGLLWKLSGKTSMGANCTWHNGL